MELTTTPFCDRRNCGKSYFLGKSIDFYFIICYTIDTERGKENEVQSMFYKILHL